MRWRIVSVGKPRLAYAREGISEYLARVRCFASVDVETIKSSTSQREGDQLLELSRNCFRLVLDERGKVFTSRQFADELGRIEAGPAKTCAIIVGGSDGHSAAVREAADLVWALSPLTLQHELALLVALEQLYRSFTIRGGLPYHRD